ncbi:hypothetical protein C8J57DRAFT_1612312 [Mycena rebaudengoi]|nr:hypothetical protein C8J57DRAFT_1612312 [Mycena rebaudengoi]
MTTASYKILYSAHGTHPSPQLADNSPSVFQILVFGSQQYTHVDLTDNMRFGQTHLKASLLVHGVVDTQNPSHVVYLQLDVPHLRTTLANARERTSKAAALTEDEGEPEAISIQSDSDEEDRFVLGPSGSNQPPRPQKEVKLAPELAAIAKTDSLFYTDDSDIEEGSVSSFHGIASHISEAAPDVPAPIVSAVVLTPALASLAPIAAVSGTLILPASVPVPVAFAVAAPAPNTTNLGLSIASNIPSALSSMPVPTAAWHVNPSTTVSMSTSSAPSTNLSASAATLHPSSMPTSTSSATTAFSAPPLPYSDDAFYATSAAALDHFDEYGNLGEPSRK